LLTAAGQGTGAEGRAGFFATAVDGGEGADGVLVASGDGGAAAAVPATSITALHQTPRADPILMLPALRVDCFGLLEVL
jgi:hypothetical protein